MMEHSLNAVSHRWKLNVQSMIEKCDRNHPVKSHHIQTRFQITGVVVREIVHHLREVENIPICSGAGGYFLAQSIGEAQHTIKQLRSRAKSLNRAAEGILDHYRKEEQLSLI